MMSLGVIIKLLTVNIPVHDVSRSDVLSYLQLTSLYMMSLGVMY
jgi:hypothetical protein